MLGALVAMVVFIFLPFFAPNLETILAGAILQGIPWGIFQTLSITYASEVMPTNLRAYLTSYVNLCWVMGQLIAAGVLKGCSTIDGKWSYRIPFASKSTNGSSCDQYTDILESNGSGLFRFSSEPGLLPNLLGGSYEKADSKTPKGRFKL